MQTDFSETSTIARNFQDEGFDRVDFEEVADMYVINTCSVTENADKQFKQVVKKAMKLNNKAFVAAVGCYVKPEELAAVDGVDLVLGATEKLKLPTISMIYLRMILVVHSCR
jgi:threonylcarbamoyladenosine tRNA methylthiotransferase MtaB